MGAESPENLFDKIEYLENRLAEAEQLIEAIKAGEVDAFAINNSNNNTPEVYTLQSSDYAYRVLIEKFNEGALSLSEEGLIVYTNTSFCDFVGRAYETVVGSHIFDYIAPDSAIDFKELFVKSFNGNSKGEINLSVNGKAKSVYVSLTSLYPNLAVIGMIITDLTEKKSQEKAIIAYQAELEKKNAQLFDKNIELQHQNAELASFSYVASHDLQEPLRKIQVFIDLLLQREGNTITDNAKNYFSRISDAAARMQKLIDALLDYSRTNTTELAFVPTNLNKILAHIQKDMQEEIRDKGVVIESDELPILPALTIQMQQLFSNIIANAIKYRKTGIEPHIKISASIVPAAEVKTNEVLPKPSYWKISIADNGIGFELQYEQRIFEIFQRLHGRSEYPGTGIGLAICKKIVQNHSGIITAEGRPDEGATFNIFLPASH